MKSPLQEQIRLPLEQSKRISRLESILFAAGEPVPVTDIRRSLHIYTEELDELIEQMQQRYSSAESGLELSVTEDTLQLKSKAQNHEYVQSALGLEHKSTLTRAGSEVLAILAYNAPLTRVQIDGVRGVNSAGALQRLIDQGLVEECGKLEVPGRPYIYRTTDLFLRMAGIKNLSELPSFESFKENFDNLEGQTNE